MNTETKSITYPCDTCKGNGKYETTYYYDDSEIPSFEGEVTCCECDGSGTVEVPVIDCGNCQELHEEGINCDTK